MAKKKGSVQLTVTKCGECPHHRVGSYYSLDGFDRGRDWTCAMENREIAGFVEWKSDEPKSVPDWCPLRKP